MKHFNDFFSQQRKPIINSSALLVDNNEIISLIRKIQQVLMEYLVKCFFY